jgi:hypothetical protein
MKRADLTKGLPMFRLPYPSAPPALLFGCKISLDRQKQSSYTFTHRKQCLIKEYQIKWEWQGYHPVLNFWFGRRPHLLYRDRKFF